MKIFKVSKSLLKFVEDSDIPDINFNFKIPILVDSEYNVILGNSLRNRQSETFFVIVLNNVNKFMIDTLHDLEKALAEENNEARFNQIEMEVEDFIKKDRVNIETFSLFDFKEEACITKETYRKPPDYDFKKHSKFGKKDPEDELSIEELMSKLEADDEEV